MTGHGVTFHHGLSAHAVYTMNYTVSQANGRERTGKVKCQK